MFLLRYAKNPKTRLRMETVYQMRCVEENTPRIEEMVKLRHKKAILLGGCKLNIYNIFQNDFFRLS